ncbi:MAG: ImmA/IrrE family metallo-endopeptidase [Deferribacteraceae bacterium]|jgi:Zn-dependent peptidase ImmA (M78 family)|nr:ImmA/IrrE family metallo-endopeptidase [Deferribacteraceae bacterium]
MTKQQKMGMVLKHLRESRAVTLSQAAKIFYLTEDEIAQYEKGTLRPNRNLLAEYSCAYDTPYNTFLLKKTYKQHHRASPLPCEKEGYEYELQAYANNIWDLKEKLQDQITPRQKKALKVCKESTYTLNDIREMAVDLRKQLGLSELGAIDFDKLNVHIFYAPLFAKIKGVSFIDEQKKSFMIFINNHDDLYKQYFSIAHELGHIMMHLSSTSDYEVQEQEADKFANSFLVPYNELDPLLDLNDETQVLAMCKKYNISMKTTYHAYENAGIISQEMREALCAKYNTLVNKPDKQGGVKENSYAKFIDEMVEKNIVTKAKAKAMKAFD